MDTPLVSATGDISIFGGNFVDNRTYHINPANTLDELRDKSSPNAIHTSAAVDSQGLCSPGTRNFTLERLRLLATTVDGKEPDVVWMHGPAGAGKSAIMRTTASVLDEEGLLLASFFFFRSDSQRNSSSPFISTLALQTAVSLPDSQSSIIDSIRKKPTLLSQSSRHQHRALLEIPLLKAAAADPPEWGPDTPLAILVDGLDECLDATQQVEVINNLVQLSTTIRDRSNRRLKIIIASRPTLRIQRAFAAHKNHVTMMGLNPSDANIDLFFDTRFDELRAQHDLPETWPPKEQIRWLNEKTSGQYSFAHVSMGFLGGGDPVARLEMLWNVLPTHDLEPFEALDALYAAVFQQLPPEMRPSGLLVARLVVHDKWMDAYTPVLEYLLGFPSGYVARLSPYLSSLIDFSSSSRISSYHATLGEFLDDPSRSGKYSLYVDPATLANAVTQGLLSLCVPSTPARNIGFEAKEVLSDVIRPGRSKIFEGFTHPDIAESLQILLNRLSELDVWSISYLQNLLRILNRQIGERPDDAVDPSLVDVINVTLPHRIEDLCRQRSSVYETKDGEMSVLVGLCYVFITTIASSESYVANLTKIVDHFTQSNQAFLELDSKKGWSLCRDGPVGRLLQPRKHRSTCFTFVKIISEFLFPDANEVSRYVSDTLAAFLAPPPECPNKIQDAISSYTACEDHKKSYRDRSTPCEKCEAKLEQLRISLIGAVYISCNRYPSVLPIRREAFVASYQFAKQSAVAWGDKWLLMDMSKARFVEAQSGNAVGDESESSLRAMIAELSARVDGLPPIVISQYTRGST